ncbi:hypothetical protein [Devosia sp. CAU 1758]
MFWEVLAIWAIVAATLVWFVRDEKRLRLDRLAARARQFATGSAWRHRDAAPPTPVPAPRPAPRSATDIQRRFIEELQQRAG